MYIASNRDIIKLSQGWREEKDMTYRTRFGQYEIRADKDGMVIRWFKSEAKAKEAFDEMREIASD